MLTHYLKELDLEPDSSLDDIKKRYRELIKKNHPDLFPNNERQKQNLKMIKINEAYMYVMKSLRTPTNSRKKDVHADAPDHYPGDESRSLAKPKDPAYAYYKQGIENYVRGHNIFNNRVKYKGRMLSISNEKILELAISSIGYYKKSYEFFLKVATEHEDSMWFEDSKVRLESIAKLNEVYRTICENLTKKIRIEEITIEEITTHDELKRSTAIIQESFRTVAEEFKLNRINCPAHPSFITFNNLKKLAESDVKFFGCFVDGLQAGFMALEKAGGGLFYIEKLAVLPEFRHRGFGQKLVKHACDFINDLGGGKISIGIIDESRKLKDWYAGLGFCEKNKKKYEHLPFTVCFMERDVSFDERGS